VDEQIKELKFEKEIVKEIRKFDEALRNLEVVKEADIDRLKELLANFKEQLAGGI
jgi:hypothetical protein